MAVNHDERVRASRWMHGLCEEHIPQGQHLSERINPQRSAKELIACDADECTAEMTAEQSPWLCSRGTRETEQEHRRATQRGQEERR